MKLNPWRMAVVLIGVIAVAGNTAFAEDEKIFSGPQVGEKLPPLKVKGVFGTDADKMLDYANIAGEKPTLLIFMHKLTRPSAGVMRTLLNFTGKKKPKAMFSGLVYLTADGTAGEKQLKRAQGVFKNRKNARVGISPDGAEGPGAYGLNRNMTLTILVANKGKVTANFALVQPSVQADVMKVIAAVVKQTGDKMPKLADLAPQRYAGKKRKKKRKKPAGRGIDAELSGLLRAVINKDAKPDDVDEAVKNLESYYKKHPKARQQVATIARRIVDAKRLENYGTKRSQEYLAKWAKTAKPTGDKPDKR